MRAHQINLLNGILQIHLPNLKCPETMKMQPKHNPVRHVFRWVTFVAYHSLVVFFVFLGFFHGGGKRSFVSNFLASTAEQYALLSLLGCIITSSSHHTSKIRLLRQILQKLKNVF